MPPLFLAKFAVSVLRQPTMETHKSESLRVEVDLVTSGGHTPRRLKRALRQVQHASVVCVHKEGPTRKLFRNVDLDLASTSESSLAAYSAVNPASPSCRTLISNVVVHRASS